MRSHIFQLLLLVLFLCIVIIPNTIAGDGTAQGYIQISLKYSLGTIGFVLSLSAIWLGCYIMTSDVESYQLHMVVTKPISRVVIWLGKYCGILLIHIILLVLASGAIYTTIMWQFNKKDFSEKDKAQIRNEVLVGRRVFYPEVPDLDKLSREVLKQKIEKAQAEGKPFDTSQENQMKSLMEIRKQLIGQLRAVKFGNIRYWKYDNLPENLESTKPIYLRYRAYVNKVSTENQRMTRGLWVAWLPQFDPKKKSENVFEEDKAKTPKYYQTALTPEPEQFMTGVFHEKILPAACIQPDGKVEIAFLNVDPKQAELFFQPGDGPKLLIRVTGFTENYIRAVFVMFLQLAILGGLACAASVLSMPTAVFVVVSYLLFGSFASFMAGTTFFSGTADYVGYYVGKILLLIIIPVQSFEVTPFIARGELIELSYIGKIILQFFVLRGLPLYLIGIWLYWRREMGLVIRK